MGNSKRMAKFEQWNLNFVCLICKVDFGKPSIIMLAKRLDGRPLHRHLVVGVHAIRHAQGISRTRLVQLLGDIGKRRMQNVIVYACT